nr:hypothetical protein [Gemmatimonadota bacterium]
GSGYEPAAQSTILQELTTRMLSVILHADTTPQTTTAAIANLPNANGWNRTDVHVVLTATDDISGVARTQVTIDGFGPAVYTAPVPITAEGVHDVAFHSIDRSQNVEAEKHLAVRIDKTAPEVVISYDPQTDDIHVEGRDSLSGTAAGPVPPKTRVDVTWTDFGSDVAELRTYCIEDRAGNVTTLYLKMRCSPVAIEATVLGIAYDDQHHRADGEQGNANSNIHGERNGRFYRERNTIVFERLLGRDDAAPLLGVRQVVAIGEGQRRLIVRTRYDVLDDYTRMSRERGTVSCVPPQRERGKDPADSYIPVAAPKTVPETDIRGLLILHIISSDGRLDIQE